MTVGHVDARVLQAGDGQGEGCWRVLALPSDGTMLRGADDGTAHHMAWGYPREKRDVEVAARNDPRPVAARPGLLAVRNHPKRPGVRHSDRVPCAGPPEAAAMASTCTKVEVPPAEPPVTTSLSTATMPCSTRSDASAARRFRTPRE